MGKVAVAVARALAAMADDSAPAPPAQVADLQVTYTSFGSARVTLAGPKAGEQWEKVGSWTRR
eukprot:4110201-Pyramimonas_sp.AAC.2